MEKRFQVFVSSTKDDLEDVRQEVSRALLESNCFPSMMELFPAFGMIDDTIRKSIEECDYFIIVVAGKYGSIHESERKSFTELEYDIAVHLGKPIVSLVHRNPDELDASKKEKDPELKKKLEAFRHKVCRERLMAKWSSLSDVRHKVSRNLLLLNEEGKADGWIRGRAVSREKLYSVVRAQFPEIRTEHDLSKIGLALLNRYYDAKRLGEPTITHIAAAVCDEIPSLRELDIQERASTLMKWMFDSGAVMMIHWEEDYKSRGLSDDARNLRASLASELGRPLNGV